MIENFKINSKEIDKIKKISKQEKDFRIDNLNLFNKKGFPDKKQEVPEVLYFVWKVHGKFLGYLVILQPPCLFRPH